MRKKREQLALEKEREYWDPLRNSSLNILVKNDVAVCVSPFKVVNELDVA